MNVSIQEILTQGLGFLVLLFVLKKLFWLPILNVLEMRRTHIKTEFEKMDAAKKEMERLKAEYTVHLQKIEDEARGKIQEAIDEGRKISRDIQEKARAESQATFEKAKENLNLEVAKARITLRREIADLAILVSEKVLQEKLAGPKEQEKVLEFIEELEKT